MAKPVIKTMNSTKKINTKEAYVFDKLFVDQHPETYEQYVVLAPNDFRNIIGDMGNVPAYQLEGLLKVKANGKAIYRKYKGASVDGKSNYIITGYRSLRYLCISEGDSVVVEKSWWLPYLWNHCENSVRYPLRIGTISLLISIILGVVGLFI